MERVGPSGNSILILGGAQFESRAEHRLSWLRFFVAFFCRSRQVPGSYLDYVITTSFYVLPNSSAISPPFSALWCRYWQHRKMLRRWAMSRAKNGHIQFRVMKLRFWWELLRALSFILSATNSQLAYLLSKSQQVSRTDFLMVQNLAINWILITLNYKGGILGISIIVTHRFPCFFAQQIPRIYNQ
jgi:hypothetical protein